MLCTSTASKEARKENAKATKERRNEGTKERRNEGTKERTKERRNEGTNERTKEGTKEGRKEGRKERRNERRNERTNSELTVSDHSGHSLSLTVSGWLTAHSPNGIFDVMCTSVYILCTLHRTSVHHADGPRVHTLKAQLNLNFKYYVWGAQPTLKVVQFTVHCSRQCPLNNSPSH